MAIIANVEMPVFRWRQLVKMMYPLCIEFAMDISVENIRIRLVDPAHVELLVLDLHPGLFTVFTVNEPVRIGWDLDKLKDALKYLDGNDVFSLTVLDELYCDVAASFEFGVYRKHVRLIDVAGMPDPKIPYLDMKRVVQVDPRGLRTAVKKMTVSDHLSLESRGVSLIVGCKGDEDNEEIRLEVLNPLGRRGKRYRSLFSLDYITGIVESVPKSMSELTMRLGTDNPVELKYVEKDREDHPVMEALYLLAPRIESE